jgi:ribosome assembly protein 4
VAWSPDGLKLASADKNGLILIWNPETGKKIGKPLTGHRQWVTYLSWQPLHLNGECRYLASSSKDASINIWDTVLSTMVRSLTSHTQSVTCIRWGGKDLIYSSSQDRTIKVWRSEDGALCRTLEGHGHWVNTLALNSDYIIRTGAFDPKDATFEKRTATDSKFVRKLFEKGMLLELSTDKFRQIFLCVFNSFKPCLIFCMSKERIYG